MYEKPISDLCILHAQVEVEQEGTCKVELPPFLDVERQLHAERKRDEKYGAFFISRSSAHDEITE